MFRLIKFIHVFIHSNINNKLITYYNVIDGDVDTNELIGLNGYLKTLDMNIRTFNIESLHEYMLDKYEDRGLPFIYSGIYIL